MAKMTKGDYKRKRIFDAYASNLQLLIDHGILPSLEETKDKTYICPICTGLFDENSIFQSSTNYLTLEDAPPKSLGGSQVALTCYSCNNGLGTDIDWHLSEKITELDYQEKITGSELKAKFSLGKYTVNGKIQVQHNDNARILVSPKNNNPAMVAGFNKLAKKGSTPSMTLNKSRVNSKKIQIALLKSAYILMFEKFGYSFLFNNQYSRVRKQLLDPSSNIYPLDCWIYKYLPKDRIGVSFITEEGLESIFVQFEVTSKLHSRLFAVILPLSTKPIEVILKELNARFSKKKTIDINMEAYTDDYLGNIKSIKLLLGWMRKFQA